MYYNYKHNELYVGMKYNTCLIIMECIKNVGLIKYDLFLGQIPEIYIKY